MNTAVIQRATPKHPSLTVDVGQVTAAIGPVPALVTPIMANEIVRFVVESTKALGQAELAVVNNQDSAGKAADLLKAIRSTIGFQETARKAHTVPLDDYKAKLMRFYGLATQNLEQAQTILKDKASVYARAERDRLQAQALADQKRIEEEASRMAAAQAALGDQEGAQEILDQAAAQTVVAGKVSATGLYGATLGLRSQKRGSVTDNRKFLKFLVAFMDSEPAYGKFVDGLRFPQSALNEMARAVMDHDLEKAVASPDGFVAEVIEDISSR